MRGNFNYFVPRLINTILSFFVCEFIYFLCLNWLNFFIYLFMHLWGFAFFRFQLQTHFTLSIYFFSFPLMTGSFFALLKIPSLIKSSAMVGERLVHRNFLEKPAVLKLLINLFCIYSDYCMIIIDRFFENLFFMFCLFVCFVCAFVLQVWKLSRWCCFELACLVISQDFFSRILLIVLTLENEMRKPLETRK